MRCAPRSAPPGSGAARTSCATSSPGCPSPPRRWPPGTIFAQPDAEQVWAQHARVVEQLTERFPNAAALLDEAGTDVLAFSAFPKEHWKQVWSNNPQERLNRELRRRTDVVGIFPNRDAVVRLVGSVLAEQHDEWAVTRRYMATESLARAWMTVIEGEAEEVTRAELADVS